MTSRSDRAGLGNPPNGNAPRPAGACRVLMIGDVIGKPGRIACGGRDHRRHLRTRFSRFARGPELAWYIVKFHVAPMFEKISTS